MRLTRHPLLALALGLAAALPVVLPALPALGQSSSGYPTACDASKVSKADVDRAHTVFLSGKGFLDESNYDKAISYFKDAYSIDCSVHAILPIIATAYERKGDKASAVQALQEYLKRVPGTSDREVVERRIKNLQDQMGPVAPATTVPPSATVAPPTPPATSSAATTVTPIASTGPASSSTAAPPESGGGHGVAPWIVVGVGGAALVAGVVVYSVGAGDVSSAEKTCPNHKNCNDPSAQSTGNSGRTLETAGVVVGAVGVAGVVGGLLWHFMEPVSSSSSSGGAVSPVVAPGYAGVSLGGKF